MLTAIRNIHILVMNLMNSQQNILQMVDAWGGWSQFQVLLQTLKKVASKHGVSIPTVAVRYILDQVKSLLQVVS